MTCGFLTEGVRSVAANGDKRVGRSKRRLALPHMDPAYRCASWGLFRMFRRLRKTSCREAMCARIPAFRLPARLGWRSPGCLDHREKLQLATRIAGKGSNGGHGVPLPEEHDVEDGQRDVASTPDPENSSSMCAEQEPTLTPIDGTRACRRNHS